MIYSNRPLTGLWLLVAFATFEIVPFISASIVDQRLNDCLDKFIAAPYPSPDDPSAAKWTSGKIGYALATLKRYPAAGDRALARQYIDDVCQLPVPATGKENEYPAYFAVPLLTRIYLDPTINGNLTENNKTAIRQVLLSFVNQRSKVTNAQRDVFYFFNSENHDLLQKSTYLLSCVVLSSVNPSLADGHSTKEHYEAWRDYFFEYFRQRAREGLNCEFGSQSYAKMSLGSIYNIADLLPSSDAADIELKSMAKKFIDLFWADYAQDFVSWTALRGGAGNRNYKNDLLQGHDSLRALLHAYDWGGGTTPDSSIKAKKFTFWQINGLPLFVSSYRVPGIVASIASNFDRAPYLSTTRRFGLAGQYNSDEGKAILFGPGNAGDIRRDTYWHNDYVLGSATYKTDGTLYGAAEQNRTVGVMFQADHEDRIIFHGKEGSRPNSDFQGVTGLAGVRCLIASRDPTATLNSGVRLFISAGNLETNKTDASGWIFTKTGGSPSSPTGTEVFVGIRICKEVGGVYYAQSNADDPYTGAVDSRGSFLDFAEQTSPFIIETASTLEFDGSFAAFQGACIANWSANGFYDQSVNKLEYTSLAGDHYEYWANSATLPKKNGVTINLNPTKTYDGPYMQGLHGDDLVTVMEESFPVWKLDFNYSQAQQWDDYQTVGLWHMEDLTDDDRFHTSRGNDLVATNATISTGGRFGSGLSFNGIDAIAAASSPWGGHAGMKTTFWFKPNGPATTERTLVTAADTWDIRQIGNDLRLYVWPTSGPVLHVTVANGATSGEWHHATAWTDIWGNVGLKVDDLAPVTQQSRGYAMKQQVRAIYLGNKAGFERCFDGQLDEVKIRDYTLNYSFSESPIVDEKQTKALWRMDASAGGSIPDDDRVNDARDNGLALVNADLSTDGVFGGSLDLTGADAMGTATNDWAAHSSVRVEFWFKPTEIPNTEGTLVTAVNTWDIRQKGEDVRFYIWTPNGPRYVTVPLGATLGEWHHVTAWTDELGNMRLEIDQLAPVVSSAPGSAMKLQTKQIQVGKSGTDRWFKGLIDDLRVGEYVSPL